MDDVLHLTGRLSLQWTCICRSSSCSSVINPADSFNRVLLILGTSKLWTFPNFNFDIEIILYIILCDFEFSVRVKLLGEIEKICLASEGA